MIHIRIPLCMKFKGELVTKSIPHLLSVDILEQLESKFNGFLYISVYLGFGIYPKFDICAGPVLQ